jgi:glycyl-tRNA synthetase
LEQLSSILVIQLIYPSKQQLRNMTAPLDLSALQDEIDAMAAQVTKQGGEVRTLKKNSASDSDAIGGAVKLLQSLKIDHKALVDKMEEASGGKDSFNRQAFDDLVLRKMFVIPSFEIHGGVKGLFDLGPPACALKVSWLVGCRLYHIVIWIRYMVHEMHML